MNIKEARELLENYDKPGGWIKWDGDPRSFNLDKEVGRAEGFLSCWESKEVRDVVDAARKAKEYFTVHRKSLSEHTLVSVFYPLEKSLAPFETSK